MRIHLILVAALAGCGGGGDDAELGDLFETVCAKYFDCAASYPDGEAQFHEDLGDTEEECVAAFRALVHADEIETSIDAGRIVVDDGALDECLGWYRTLGCEEVWSDEPQEPPACESWLIGTVEDGDACTNSNDCAVDTSSCDPDAMTCTP